MKRLLIMAILLAGLWSQAQGETIAYVVNSDTVQSHLTYDTQWVDFFKNDMGLTVKVITDDSCARITSLSSYDGYFLSATISSADLSNLDPTVRGVVICDQLLYDDLKVATGQTGLTSLASLNMDRFDSTHVVTKYMFNKITFAQSGGQSYYAYTGIPSGATVWFDPTQKYWDGEHGTPDTAFCYGIDTGGALTSGTAAGRRAVALCFYSLLTQTTDQGWCHPKELMGNICGWAWGIEENQFNSEYNCYSTDMATSPGPEIKQAWAEYGSNWRYIYYNGRIGVDGRPGLMFLALREWTKKTMSGYEPDSLRFTFKISYRGFGTDTPPSFTDTVTIDSILSTTQMFIDTTTFSSITRYDWRFQGTQSYGILIRSGTGADTVQVGDTCQLSSPTSAQTSRYANYSRCGVVISGQTCSGIWNGVSGRQMKVLLADPYGGFDFWLKMYAITPTTVWDAPLASAGQGGNPEGSSTRTWVNRNYIRNGATGAVAWSATDLVAGVDHPAAAIDSFRFNRTTFAPDGSSTVRFVLPGSYLNDPNFNWLVFKSIDLSGGNDSTDIEIIPQSIVNVRGSNVQKFEIFLSGASPQTLGADDTTMTFSGTTGETVASQTNSFVNTGDGVVALDSIVVRGTGSWLGLIPSYGNTPQTVLYTINTTGLSAGTYTDTVKVYASTADNTPLITLAVLTLTDPPVEAPPATVEKRTGLRKQ